MKKQLLFLTLFLSFGMGWIAFFSPAQSEFNKEKSQESFLTESSGFYLGYGLVSERNSVSEIPTFKVDWTQDGKINSTWSTEFVRYHRLIGSEFWTAGSAPLFDVKILFQQYFYPW